MKRLFRIALLLPIITSCSHHKNSISFTSNANTFYTRYDDSYFLLDNKEYQQEIAIASFASSMATINNDKDYTKRGDYLIKLWKKQGFDNIYLNQDFLTKPTINSVGYGIASKKIDDFNLIAVTVRSGAYDAEWANNFLVGTEGHSKGFYDSSVTVFEGLINYITNYKIEGYTKFWLSGYSRGASIVNLVAAELLDEINLGTFSDSILTSIDDVYAYCFEPPAAAAVSDDVAKSDLYKCIHNVLNFNDPIPLTIPFNWGFVRYGQNRYYPDRITDIYFDKIERKKLITNYHYTNGGHKYADYTVDDWKFYDPGEEDSKENNLPRASVNPSLGRFARNIVNAFTAGAVSVSREFYVQSGSEEGIRNIFATIYGYNPKIKEIEMSGSLLLDFIFSYSFIQSMVTELQQENYDGFANDVEFLLYELFGANEENIDAIKELYEGIYYLLLFAFQSIVERTDVMLQLLSRDNLLTSFSCHATELNYSFLESCDQRLYGNDACHLNDGTYQVLHIDTPTKVSIYEKNLKKTIFSYANGKMSSDTLSAEKLADGSLDIYLPNNGEYDCKTDSEFLTLGKIDEHGIETVIKTTKSNISF